MWNANLIFKQERTDGGIDFNVEFSDGTRKFQKLFTFFGDFNLEQVVQNQIDIITTLYSKSDTIQPGQISLLKKEVVIQPNQLTVDVQNLNRLQRAVHLGLIKIDDPILTAQIAQVQKNPDFLTLI